MQPQDHQQPFFAFSVPPKVHQSSTSLLSSQSTSSFNPTSLAPILTSNLALFDQLPRSPSLDSSRSPSSALLRPTTASGLFAYSVPPIPLQLSPPEKHTPASSAPRPPPSSANKTSPTTTPLSHLNSTPPLPPPVGRLSLSSTDSSASPASFHLLAPPPAPPPPFQYGIGPHNTRPMTAPGAGWDAGSFNHDYDYTTASLGLYGTSAYQIDSPVLSPPTTVPTHSSPDDAGSSTTATSPDQMLSLFPCFAPPIMLPTTTTTTTSTSSRPSTHAGTQLSFGAASAIRDGDGTLRPSTAASTSDHHGLPLHQRPDTSPYELWKTSSPASAGLVDHYQQQLHQGFQVLQSLRCGTTGARGSDATAAPPHHQHHLHYQQQRPFQFNLLPGAPRKRARRRFDEVERLYQCNYPGCTKSYGTLNHLNAHIMAQKHGPKRLPQEFKEIRKEWRARKKAEAEARTANLLINHNHQPQQSSSVGSTAAYLGGAWNGSRGKQ